VIALSISCDRRQARLAAAAGRRQVRAANDERPRIDEAAAVAEHRMHSERRAAANPNLALEQNLAIRERGGSSPPTERFRSSNFGLFVRLIELHEYRRSTSTD